MHNQPYTFAMHARDFLVFLNLANKEDSADLGAVGIDGGH